MRRDFLILAASLCCTGCATNYYDKFYVDSFGERNMNSVHGDASVVLQTMETEEDVIRLIEAGYVRSGISSFYGPYTSCTSAVETAEKHGAALVLLDVRLRGTNHHASAMYLPPCSAGAGISPTDALPLRYSPSLQSKCDWAKKVEEIAERKYEEERRARFSRKGWFLWMTTYSLDEEAAKDDVRDEKNDPRYYNILVGGANAAGEGFTALSGLPFGVFAKDDNKELFRNGEVQEIRYAIERAVRHGKNVRVFGHSWGGATVANLALEYPDIPFYALDPVSWTHVLDEIPENLTIYHPNGTDDIDFPRLAQIFGGQWPIIDKEKTKFYNGDHFAGLREEMKNLNTNMMDKTLPVAPTTPKMNAVSVEPDVDIYDHDAMFFKKIDTSNLYGVYWHVPRRLPEETAESPVTVRILAVLHGSPAEKDGIKRGQVVKAINGVAIKTRADIAPYVNREACIKKLEVGDAP